MITNFPRVPRPLFTMPREDQEQVITKRFVLEHTDEDEVDLSLCNLTKVPVKELVREREKEKERERERECVCVQLPRLRYLVESNWISLRTN